MTAATRTEAPVPATYSLGAGGSGGIWFGLCAGQVSALGVGLLASIAILTAGVDVMLALIPIVVSVGVAGARVGGRPLTEWTIPLGRHAAAVAAGASAWTSPAPGVALASADPRRLRLPAEFGRVSVTACPSDQRIAVIRNTSDRTLTAVFDLCGVDRFPLLDAAERDTLLAGWGESLAVLTDTDRMLRRLQLIERAAPAAGDTTDRDLGDPQLSEEIAAFAVRHASRLAVQWAFPRLDEEVISAMPARCQAVSSALVPARLAARPCSVPEVLEDFAAALGGWSPSTAAAGDIGPVSRRNEWTLVRVDDRLHRSFAVTGWPRTAVSATWLSPLLLAAPPRSMRTVALHLEPVAPAAAARIARTRRAKAELDQSERARFGMTTSASLDLAQASGVAMDAELAAGYRTHRLAGIVTVSAETLEDLDAAGWAVRQAAAVSRLELQPLHGQHHIALAATVPLCRVQTRNHG